MRVYIVSQFLHRPGRALGVIGGVALGAALFVALTSLGAGFRQASQAPLAGVAADLLITRPSQVGSAAAQRTRGPRLPFGSTPFSSVEVNSIKAGEGINKIATALEIWDFGANQYQIILGVNPDEKQLGPGRILQEGLVYLTWMNQVLLLLTVIMLLFTISNRVVLCPLENGTFRL
jgi:ABC-type antimicrobial peptide transport system permease subunit